MVGDEAVRDVSFAFCFFGDDPVFGTDLREEGIAVEGFLYFCDVEGACVREEGFVHVLAADDEVFSFGEGFHEGFHVVEEENAFGRFVVLISCEDVVNAAGKDAREAFEGLPSHDNRMAHRQFLEPLEVVGEVPEKGIVLSDGVIGCFGNDDGEAHTDTSMAILS